MAGVLRNLRPTMEPTGRVIMNRQLAGGDPHQSRLVEVRLGCREDRADFAEGFCRARRKGSFDQCGRRPAHGAVVCAMHGGGHVVRQRAGTRLSPQEAGRLSGLARRLKRDGRVDLAQLPSLVPQVQQSVQRFREQPQLLGLQADVERLTALRDLVLSGQFDIEIGDLTRLVAVLAQVKANVLRTQHALQSSSMVPAERVHALMAQLIEIIRRHVPEEQHPEVARELALLGARPPEAAVDPPDCPSATGAARD